MLPQCPLNFCQFSLCSPELFMSFSYTWVFCNFIVFHLQKWAKWILNLRKISACVCSCLKLCFIKVSAWQLPKSWLCRPLVVAGFALMLWSCCRAGVEVMVTCQQVDGWGWLCSVAECLKHIGVTLELLSPLFLQLAFCSRLKICGNFPNEELGYIWII